MEIARRLQRDVDTGRTLDARGRPIAPNSFLVHLAPADFQRFSQIRDALRLEFIGAAREHAEGRGLGFLGRVGVSLVEDDQLITGRFRAEATYSEGQVAGATPAFLETSDGRKVALGAQVAIIGRIPESAVYLDDANVSRRHAELRPDGDTFVIVDLGSTNGTRVNGVAVREQTLADGDVIAVGRHTLTLHLL